MLIERPANDGLAMLGSQVTVNDSVIRDGAKFGFIVFPDAMARSKLVAQRVVLERNTRVGVLVEDSDVTLRDFRFGSNYKMQIQSES